jgi:hypothetical protein
MFWAENEEAASSVCTENDLNTFTHILYLDVPPNVIAQYRLGDKKRVRPSASVAHIHRWLEAEKTQ